MTIKAGFLLRTKQLLTYGGTDVYNMKRSDNLPTVLNRFIIFCHMIKIVWTVGMLANLCGALIYIKGYEYSHWCNTRVYIIYGTT